MNDILKINFNNHEENGYYTECNRCKGTGDGYGPDKGKVCWACNGKGRFFHPFFCHNNVKMICEREKCNLWDKDHGGGCLQRKLLIKQIYGMFIK